MYFYCILKYYKFKYLHFYILCSKCYHIFMCYMCHIYYVLYVRYIYFVLYIYNFS